MSLALSARNPVARTLQRYSLSAEHELRLLVAPDQGVHVTSGNAECFGTELAVNHQYFFQDCSLAIFTWFGAELELQGECHAYVASETPMNMYVNIHAVLQTKREQARSNCTLGPKVMLVGGVDAGKSTLALTLCNWGARTGEDMTLVDLDVGQGAITVPGSIAALAMELPTDLEEHFGLSSPLAYFFGDVSPGSNPKLYVKLMQQLSDTVHLRMDQSIESSSAGCVINTCGWVDGVGFDLLVDSIEIFKPDHIFVVDHERLHSDLVQALTKKGLLNSTLLVKLPKSGGVVSRDPTTRRKTRSKRIKEYFYGPLGDLSPHSTIIPISNLAFYKLAVGPQVPNYALPIGASATTDQLKPQLIAPTSELAHSIVSVSYATDAGAIVEANSAGFLTEVNLERGTITALQPCAGQLPSKLILVGNLKYIE